MLKRISRLEVRRPYWLRLPSLRVPFPTSSVYIIPALLFLSKSVFVLLVEISPVFGSQFLLVNTVELSIQHPHLLASVVSQLLGERIANEIQDAHCFTDRLQLVQLSDLIFPKIDVLQFGKTRERIELADLVLAEVQLNKLVHQLQASDLL